MKMQQRVAVATVTMLLLITGQALWAQRDAASKIDGAAYEAPYFYSTMGTYQDNAYAHAQVLQQATAAGTAVPQAIAKEHTDAIRANLAAAQRHHTSLKQASKAKKSASDHFRQIDEHHAKALAHCDQIDAACKSGKGDAAAVHKSATAVVEELKSAHDKHIQVAEHLKAAK